jgi:hypothetical protein
MIRFASLLVALSLVSATVPSIACGPDTSASSEREEMLPNAVVVTGTASSIDRRDPSAPVLFLSYPMEPGQTSQSLYGAFVTLTPDANARLLQKRIQKGQAPHVLLARPAATGAWRVAAFLPRR